MWSIVQKTCWVTCICLILHKITYQILMQLHKNTRNTAFFTHLCISWDLNQIIFKTGIQNGEYISKLTRFPLLYLLDIQQYVTQTFNNMEKPNKSQTRHHKIDRESVLMGNYLDRYLWNIMYSNMLVHTYQILRLGFWKIV